MRKQRTRPIWIVPALAMLFAADAGSQTGGSFGIAPAAIAGGGGPIAGGSFALTGTLGQPATSILSGGSFRMFDGFWSPVGLAVSDVIFRNGFDP